MFRMKTWAFVHFLRDNLVGVELFCLGQTGWSWHSTSEHCHK